MTMLEAVKVDLGLDLGTDGPSWVAIDQDTGKVLEVGEGPKFPKDVCEHDPVIWEERVVAAMQNLHAKLEGKGLRINKVGRMVLTGMMHGEVLIGSDGKALGPVRLWNHPGNAEEGLELTRECGVKLPTRMTASRFLWTARHQPKKAEAAIMMATPTIYLFWLMTGQHVGGIGECSGMFPIDPETGTYFPEMIDTFDRLVGNPNIMSIDALLPTPARAGQTVGELNAEWAEKLGLPAGTKFGPTEGDQEAALAASLISEPGKIAFAGGTSVCANAVCDKLFQGVHRAIDHFLDAAGTAINMIWLVNGTAFMNWVVALYKTALMKHDNSLDDETAERKAWVELTEMAFGSPADCRGLSGLPFMNPEPGLGFGHGGVAFIASMKIGEESNANFGALFRLSFLLTLLGVKHGVYVLRAQGYEFDRTIITGGVANSPELMGQMIADALDIPAEIRESAQEGGALGAAYLARFTRLVADEDPKLTWEQFTDNMLAKQKPGMTFEPKAEAVAAYKKMYDGYIALMSVEEKLLQVEALAD